MLPLFASQDENPKNTQLVAEQNKTKTKPIGQNNSEKMSNFKIENKLKFLFFVYINYRDLFAHTTLALISNDK